MKKNNLKELYFTNTIEHVEEPPENPSCNTRYVLTENFNKNPYKYLSLSLSQSSTHKNDLFVENTNYRVRFENASDYGSATIAHTFYQLHLKNTCVLIMAP